jgi:hypothetical protein
MKQVSLFKETLEKSESKCYESRQFRAKKSFASLADNFNRFLVRPIHPFSPVTTDFNPKKPYETVIDVFVREGGAGIFLLPLRVVYVDKI